MKFDLTPEEAWAVAEAAATYYADSGHTISIEETPWEDAPYVTTLVARRRVTTAPTILIEAQSELDYTGSVRELMIYIQSESCHAEFYIAVGEDAVLHARTLSQLAREGVGLLLVDGDGRVNVHRHARNPALTVNPDPALRFGRRSQSIRDIFEKFNNGNRQDALRDMCELVEELTAQVGFTAIGRGVLTIREQDFEGKNWNDRINTLASNNVTRTGQDALFNHRMTTDLHAFRNARNLVDHPPRSLRNKYERERQFVDKLLLGSRMVAELGSLRDRVRRL